MAAKDPTDKAIKSPIAARIAAVGAHKPDFQHSLGPGIRPPRRSSGVKAGTGPYGRSTSASTKGGPVGVGASTKGGKAVATRVQSAGRGGSFGFRSGGNSTSRTAGSKAVGIGPSTRGGAAFATRVQAARGGR